MNSSQELAMGKTVAFYLFALERPNATGRAKLLSPGRQPFAINISDSLIAMKQYSRDLILKTGLDLLSRSGLSAVTFGLLAQEVGMSKSGLFAYFTSKEEVQLKLLEKLGEVFTAHVIVPSMSAEEGLPRLTAIVNNWLGWTTKCGLSGGCPVAAGMFELDDVENPVRDHMIELEKNWREILVIQTNKAIELNQLHRELDTDQFVWELGAIYLAHHVSSRFVKDVDAKKKAHKAIESLFARSGG